MGRRNRECYLCGKSYQYCSTCSQDKMKPSWMSEFHNENCKNIFDICTRFNMKLLTKDEARVAMEQCDLTNKSNFKTYVQRDLDNIFAVDKSSEKVEENIVEIKEEPIVVEEVPNDDVVIKPTPVRNKTKKRTHEVVKKENE